VADPYEITRLAPEEMPAFFEAVGEAFQEDLHDEDVALWGRTVEPERTLVARADGAIAGGAALLTMQLSIPGGRVVPMAGVTGVGVDPVHRRRGPT
jgi:predicted acetyltransferase